MHAQPPSIHTFEKFFWASLLAGVVNIMFNWDYVTATLLEDPGLNIPPDSIGIILMVAVIFGLGINILLWFLITQKSSKVGKWVFAVFTAYGVISGIAALFVAPQLTLILGTISTALSAGALYMLFRPDALAWFDGESFDAGDTF